MPCRPALRMVSPHPPDGFCKSPDTARTSSNFCPPSRRLWRRTGCDAGDGLVDDDDAGDGGSTTEPSAWEPSSFQMRLRVVEDTPCLTWETPVGQDFRPIFFQRVVSGPRHGVPGHVLLSRGSCKTRGLQRWRSSSADSAGRPTRKSVRSACFLQFSRPALPEKGRLSRLAKASGRRCLGGGLVLTGPAPIGGSIRRTT